MFDESQSLKILNSKVKKFPEILITLGSGWNKALENAEVETEISYKELFGFEASVPGHEGKLVIAQFSDSSTGSEPRRVACMAGRPHMYEGYSAREATLPLRVFAKAGVKKTIFTAACGALNEHYKVGDFVILSDILTLFLAIDNPLIGPDFVDVSQVFNPQMRQSAIKICVENQIPMQQGTYVYYHGPNYETPADKMALRHMGGDIVGMSTVPETIMAKSLGLEVLGISFVTNLAFVKHDHKEVVEQANKASEQMVKLLTTLVQEI